MIGVAVAASMIEKPATSSIAETASDIDNPLIDELTHAQQFESHDDWVHAAEAYRHAAALTPDPAVSLRLAFALLRAGQPDAATQVANSVEHGAPDNADAVLVLGLAQRASSDPEADQTLSRFLAIAPGHPAAAEVRRILGHKGH